MSSAWHTPMSMYIEPNMVAAALKTRAIITITTIIIIIIIIIIITDRTAYTDYLLTFLQSKLAPLRWFIFSS